MKQKTPPKSRPPREAITLEGSYLVFLEREVKALKIYAQLQPKIEIIKNSKSGQPTSIDISVENTNLEDFLEVYFQETILPGKNDFKIKRFRFQLRPKFDLDDFFRFDFAPNTIPDKYPPCHINVNHHRYGGNGHLVFPNDTLIDPRKLTAEKATKIFEEYVTSQINPATQHGEHYLNIVDTEEDYS